jgi:hypothetical protein
MNEKIKEVFNSLKNNPSDPFKSFKECSEQILNGIIEDLEEKETKTNDEENTLNQAKEIYKLRFGKGTTK